MLKGNYTQQDIECHSLSEVRLRIDKLDTILVKILAERSQLINQVVKFKNNSSDIDAPQRIEEVLNNIRQIALKENMDQGAAEDIYRTIINTFRKQQRMQLIPQYDDIRKSYY